MGEEDGEVEADDLFEEDEDEAQHAMMREAFKRKAEEMVGNRVEVMNT